MNDTTLPDWHLKIAIKNGRVVAVDHLDERTSATLSTPPTVAQIKQWLADAAKMLGD